MAKKTCVSKFRLAEKRRESAKFESQFVAKLLGRERERKHLPMLSAGQSVRTRVYKHSEKRRERGKNDNVT